SKVTAKILADVTTGNGGNPYFVQNPQKLDAQTRAKAIKRFYDTELTNARLGLCQATRVVLRNGLGVFGISAPEQM
ncbi:MAG: DALR anticodon-binding domain-containing protein, partial [Bacteroidota bacterium]